MLKSLTFAAALLAAAPAFAGNTHLDRSVEQVLRNYNIDLQVSELSNHQKSSIVLIAHQGDGNNKRAQILSALGEGLFGTIFNR